jgi:hypothetical protein
MINKIKNIVNDMTWFLRTGVAPNKEENENLKNLNHMQSKKFAMTMVAISIIAFMYFVSVLFLFLFDGDPHITALVSMYKDMMVGIASIAASLVGIQGLVDWKHNSSSSSSNTSETIKEEYLSGPKEDDYTLKL